MNAKRDAELLELVQAVYAFIEANPGSETCCLCKGSLSEFVDKVAKHLGRLDPPIER